MHHIRFRMLKYHIKNNFTFRRIPYFGAAGYSRSIVEDYEASGLVTLGFSVKKSGAFTIWGLMDALYYLMILLIPFYPTNYVFDSFFNKCEEKFGCIGGTLQNPMLDMTVFLGSVLALTILPHLIALYFNRKRFQYYLAYRVEGKAWW